MGGGQLRVIFPEVAGEPEDFDQIRKIILDILPCHLEVEFYFRYLTWAECEARRVYLGPGGGGGIHLGEFPAGGTAGAIAQRKKAAALTGGGLFLRPEETGRAAV